MPPDPAEDVDLNGDVSSFVGPLRVDELFDVLSRPGNRFVLTYVLLQDEPVSVVDLVDYVLAETQPPQGMTRAEFGGQLLNAFLGTILPTLDERGLLSYDTESRIVAETNATVLTLPYLRAGLHQARQRQSEQSS